MGAMMDENKEKQILWEIYMGLVDQVLTDMVEAGFTAKDLREFIEIIMGPYEI